jgi:EAL domain-containing protein (putative c-di-GMP-specific phosphodiesterase class I)
MYVAKLHQRHFAFYDAAQDPHNPHRLALFGDLRKAIRSDQLLLYYQPKVVASSGQFCGVEALVRWHHPSQGLLMPDQFIPMAERTGMIVPLTTWVLETALQQCQAWARAGLPVNVAINLSAHSLQDAQLPRAIEQMLNRYSVSPKSLTFEITESALMADPTCALEVLTGLHALGVGLAIDDFGTGYSSLGYLKNLPVDEVKVDKSFVLSMGDVAATKDAAIVRSVIAMAHAMDLLVVAEGVESRVSWDLLHGLSCDTIQGYFISRPLPVTELESWMSALRMPAVLDISRLA